MTNTPTTLGSLEFKDIKKSLTDYLRNQSVLSGYKFEGSILQSVIDLLSYNTFYYAYYSNIINAEAFIDSAQRESSMISLTKALGYTVPARTAAISNITLSGLSPSISTIPRGTQFISKNENGKQYSFWTIDNIPVVGTSVNFDIYEGTSYIEYDALPEFNYTTQKVVFVSNTFDLSTISVSTLEYDEATASTVTYKWTKVNSIGYASQTDDRIYFVERTPTGFAIIFGSINSLGKSIEDNVNIKNIIITYVETSGSSGNGLLNYTPPSVYSTAIVTTNTQSSGGANSPNLDAVRFLAPKWFAAQERAVTVNDYKALLLEAGYFQNETEFNVFGGQDLSPPRFGRVFLSSNINFTDQQVSEMINFLQDKSVITVLPEYVQSNVLSVYADFTFRLSNTILNRTELYNNVVSYFNGNYAKSSEYNVSFSSADFVEAVTAEYPEVIITSDDFNLYVRETLNANTEYTFNLQNELYLPLGISTDITEPFVVNTTNYPSFPTDGSLGVLKIYAQSTAAKNSKINLQLWARNAAIGNEQQVSGVDVGYFIANTGVINIKSGVIADNFTTILNVDFKKKNFSIGLNNLISFTANKVTLL